MAFKLNYSFGLYLPGQGPPDCDLFDEVWPINKDWDGRARGAIVFDTDFFVSGSTPGVVRIINIGGDICGATRRTHKVIRKAGEPQPGLLCQCGHFQCSHFCIDQCNDIDGHRNEHGAYEQFSPTHGGCNYPGCRCQEFLDGEPDDDDERGVFELDEMDALNQ